MKSFGVIEKVDEYLEWCVGMVVAPKTNGDVKICVDLTKLIVEEILATLEGSRVFSKMGTNSAFWQIKLEEES